MLIEILAPSHTILPCVCKLFVIIVTPLCKGVKVVHVLFNNSQERVIDDGYTIIYWIIMTGKSESVMLKQSYLGVFTTTLFMKLMKITK